jgi:hypothetical protein
VGVRALGRREPGATGGTAYRGAVPRRDSPYGGRYELERQQLLALRLPCHLRLVCDGVPADSADHDPPLALHAHVNGSGCCRLVPACLDCQRVQGKQVAVLLRRRRAERPVPVPSRRW